MVASLDCCFRFLEQPRILFLGALSLGHVAGEAARVTELAVALIHARVDQHVLDRSILRAQTGLITAQGLICGKTRENIVEHRTVDMELSEMVTNIFVGRIAEELELRVVGPNDRAVARNRVDAFGGVFKKISELLLDVFGRVDAKAVLELDRSVLQARIVREQVGTEGVVQLFRRRWELIAESAKPELASLPVEQRAHRLAEMLTSLEGTDWTTEAIDAALRALLTAKEWSVKEAFMLLRAILTGSAQSPPLLESLVVFGKARSIDRIRRFIDNQKKAAANTKK